MLSLPASIAIKWLLVTSLIFCEHLNFPTLDSRHLQHRTPFSSLIMLCSIPQDSTVNRQSSTSSTVMCDESRVEREPKRSRTTIDNSDLGSACLTLRPTASKAKKRLSLPPRKSVQFSSISDLVLFEQSHSNVLWYTSQDQQRFKQEQKIDIKMFREHLNSAVPSPTSSCPVGIEQHIFAPDMTEAYLFRKFVIQSVMFEQKRQRFLGYYDPAQIASLVERLTAESCANALMRGQYHEELAKIAVLDGSIWSVPYCSDLNTAVYIDELHTFDFCHLVQVGFWYVNALWLFDLRRLLRSEDVNDCLVSKCNLHCNSSTMSQFSFIFNEIIHTRTLASVMRYSPKYQFPPYTCFWASDNNSIGLAQKI